MTRYAILMRVLIALNMLLISFALYISPWQHEYMDVARHMLQGGTAGLLFSTAWRLERDLRAAGELLHEIQSGGRK